MIGKLSEAAEKSRKIRTENFSRFYKRTVNIFEQQCSEMVAIKSQITVS